MRKRERARGDPSGTRPMRKMPLVVMAMPIAAATIVTRVNRNLFV